jgi:hypothetical protein
MVLESNDYGVKRLTDTVIECNVYGVREQRLWCQRVTLMVSESKCKGVIE